MLGEALIKTVGNTDLLLSGAPRVGEGIPRVQVAQLIEFARRNYNVVSADLPDTFDETTLAVLRDANKIMLVTTPELPALRLAHLKVLLLRKLDLFDKVSLLVNRVSSQMRSPSPKLRRPSDCRCICRFPSDYADVTAAIRAGRPAPKLAASVQKFARDAVGSARRSPKNRGALSNALVLFRCATVTARRCMSTARTAQAENRKRTDPSVVRVRLKDQAGNARWATAYFRDVTEEGVGLSLMTPLQIGSMVVIRGNFGEGRDRRPIAGGREVVHRGSGGVYQAGLELTNGQGARARNERREAEPRPAKPCQFSDDPEQLDCYEIMQLSPKAGADTIHRVHRILAQRYHPDTPDTGNAEMFIRVTAAARILSDPEQRAKYDIRYHATRQLHWKIFDQAEAVARTAGRKGEAERHSWAAVCQGGARYRTCVHDGGRL